MERYHNKSLFYYPLPFSLSPASLLISNPRTAASKHFNACQQYVQKTCCACKQTHTETLIHAPNPDQASSDGSYR